MVYQGQSATVPATQLLFSLFLHGKIWPVGQSCNEGAYQNISHGRHSQYCLQFAAGCLPLSGQAGSPGGVPLVVVVVGIVVVVAGVVVVVGTVVVVGGAEEGGVTTESQLKKENIK